MLFKDEYPPANRGIVIVWGMISSFPFGGIFWQVLHHIVGFRRLGFDVWYVEDSDRYIYDTKDWMPTTDFTEALKTLSGIMDCVGFKDRWIFRVPGKTETCVGGANFKQLIELYQKADAVFNLCGIQELLPYHENIRCRVLLETDPCFPQIRIASGNRQVIEEYNQYQYIFTYGENIGNDDCLIPVEGMNWIPTRPPVITDWWNPTNEPAETKKLTTISNWDTKDKGIEWQGDRYYWNKDFTRFNNLPAKSKIPLELWLSTINQLDINEMRNKGWLIVSYADRANLDDYHSYICNSLGEFTVAKDCVVRLRSGWFSDRSVCYLAARRPVITEETGFSKFIPSGEGLFAFREIDEIISATEAINANYELHSNAAYEIAEEYFKAEKVLGKLIEIIGL